MVKNIDLHGGKLINRIVYGGTGSIADKATHCDMKIQLNSPGDVGSRHDCGWSNEPSGRIYVQGRL